MNSPDNNSSYRSGGAAGLPYSRHFLVQGGHLAVYADTPGITEAIHARLQLLATGAADAPDLSFEIRSVPEPRAHWIAQPPGSSRPVYNPPAGEVLYLEAGDQLYISFDDRVRVLSNFREGRTRVSVLQEATDNLWLVSHPLFTIPLIEHLKRRRRYSLHAASMCLNGQGLLLPGSSGSGKSTLALALLRGGFGFMGDDMVFLARDGGGLQMFGFPEDVDVTETTAAFFPELQDLPAAARLPGAKKWQITTQDIYGSTPVRQCPPVVLVFPQIVQQDKSELVPMDEGQALRELVPNVLLTDPASSQKHLNVIGDLVKTCDCYRLHTGKDLEAVPALLRPLLS